MTICACGMSSDSQITCSRSASDGNWSLKRSKSAVLLVATSASPLATASAVIWCVPITSLRKRVSMTMRLGRNSCSCGTMKPDTERDSPRARRQRSGSLNTASIDVTGPPLRASSSAR